jgi:hypothetical protein
MTISGAQIVAEVQKLGKAAKGYELGGVGPAFYDCSGLVQKTLTDLGDSNVPRTSEEQFAWADKISKSDLQPGDLVFAQFPGDGTSPGHVGIYVGGGQVYSAQDPSLGIGLASLASWGSNVVGYGRAPGSSGDATTTADTTGLFSWPSDITGFFGDAKTGIDALMWLVNPASWLRIGSFFIGAVLLVLAIYVFIRAGSDQPIMPSAIPVPILV